MTEGERVTVWIVEDESFGWFVYVREKDGREHPVAFRFTHWGARWTGRKVLRKLQRGLVVEAV